MCYIYMCWTGFALLVAGYPASYEANFIGEWWLKYL